MTDDRLHALAERHLEGSLTEDEARELASALEASAELRARLLKDVALAGLLARAHAAAPEGLDRKVLAALRGGADKDALVGRVMAGLPARRTRRVFWVAGLAAGVLLMLVALYPGRRLGVFTSYPALNHVAQVVQISGVARLDGNPVSLNDGIPAGGRLEVDDDVHLFFRNGGKVVVGKGSSIRLQEDGVRLEHGDLSTEKAMLRVRTEHGEVRLLGDAITLHAEPAGTRLEVKKGHVRFERRADWVSVDVVAGQYAVACRGMDLFEARPVAGEARVQEAVQKGLVYVMKAKPPVSGWNGPMGSDELVLTTFLKAGVPVSDPRVDEHLRKMLASKLQRTYCVSLHAVALRELDAAKYRSRIAECAQFLVDNQCANGQWGYGEASAAAPAGDLVTKSRDGPATGNNSCSQFAVLGLRACVEAGIAIPRETLERASRWWGASQRADLDTQFGADRKGWCYTREEDPHRPYGSMTAGGVAAAVIADALLGRDWRQDPVVASGMNWLSYHFTINENYGPVEELMAKEMVSDTPNPMTEYYYYLWALERAAALQDATLLGTRDWWNEGARELLSAQKPDGSWGSGIRRCNPVWDTCYAILFLTRSTRPIEVKR